MTETRWIREGLVLGPPETHAWWTSHAQQPTILPLEDGLWRVYFGARDARPVSRIMCVDVDPLDNMRIIKLHDEPVLEHGAPGCFDCHGIGPACAIRIGGRIYLYYTGVYRRSDVPYGMGIGLAVSDDGLNFARVSDGPVMGQGPRDPYYASAPYVGKRGAGFEMWYVSGLGWSRLEGEDREEPVYNIRRTYSDDGVIWSPASEYGFGETGMPKTVVTRAWLVERGDTTQVWYSHRGSHGFRSRGADAYKIWMGALAGSDRRLTDAAPIRFESAPSESDWDGEMQTYPCVAPVGDDLVMLYNGNGFGRTGFGYARLAGGARFAG